MDKLLLKIQKTYKHVDLLHFVYCFCLYKVINNTHIWRNSTELSVLTIIFVHVSMIIIKAIMKISLDQTNSQFYFSNNRNGRMVTESGVLNAIGQTTVT